MQNWLNDIAFDIYGYFTDYPILYLIFGMLLTAGIGCTVFGVICNKYIECSTVDTVALLHFGIITLVILLFHICMPCMVRCCLNWYFYDPPVYPHSLTGAPRRSQSTSGRRVLTSTAYAQNHS